MAGFDNDVVYGTNIDLRGVKPVVGQFTTDGQLLIGATASPYARIGSLTSNDDSITITNGPGTIDLSSGILTATVTLTSAEVKDLVANPKEIIPSPGAGNSIYVIGGWYKVVVASSAFTGGQTLSLVYNSDANYYAGSDCSSTLIDSASTSYIQFVNGVFSSSNIIPQANVQGQNVTLINFSGMNIGGNAGNDNSLVVLVYYRINAI